MALTIKPAEEAADDPVYRVEELAVATGVAVDTIRYYQTKGLLSPPERQGRKAIYSEAHRARVDMIRRLADEGFTLNQIKQLVDGTDDKLLSMLSTDQEFLTIDELAAAAGVDPQVVTMAVAAELISPVGSNRFEAEDVRLVRTARDLIESGIPIQDLVALATQHAANVEAVADQAIELFSRHIGDNSDEPGVDVVDTYRRLMAQTTKLVAEHFQRTLVERGRLHLDDEMDPDLAAALTDPDQRLIVSCEWT